MKKLIIFIAILFWSIPIVYASDISLELCEYSDEYIAWLNLSEEKRANTLMPNMCKQDSEEKLISSHNYDMSYFTLQNDYILDIKDQSISDDCWAFATLASIESNLLMNNINTDYLSVAHLELMTQDSLYTPSFTTFNRSFNSGGKLEYTAAYVLNHWGPITEDKLPFKNIIDLINQNKTITEKDVTDLKASVDVDNIFYLNNKQGSCSANSIETIKKYLVNYGALAASIYFDLNNADYLNNAYYYYNGSNISNHAVAIIGWDDSVEVTSFTNNSSQKGAWIVKNSYGTNVGDNGYFYVSYDDINICTNIVGFYDTDLNVSSNVYYYDDLGTNVFLTSNSDENYLANVFTKNSDKAQKIDKITFASSTSGVKYTVYYASNSSLTSYEEIASGTTPHAGYISVTPKNDIYVSDEFSIIVKYETSSSTEDIIPVAMKSSQSSSPYYNFKTTKMASYLSIDGTTWIDTAEKLNIQNSIRVYTTEDEDEITPPISDTSSVDDSASVELVNPNEETTTSSIGDTLSETPTSQSSETTQEQETSEDFVVYDEEVGIPNPKTGIISGISIIITLIIIGTIIYFKKKNKIFKI